MVGVLPSVKALTMSWETFERVNEAYEERRRRKTTRRVGKKEKIGRTEPLTSYGAMLRSSS